KAGALGQAQEAVGAVLVGVLGVQALAGLEAEGALLDAHLLCQRADQVHLDARFARVEEGAVAEAARLDVAVQLATDASQQIEIESGGDAGAVVVGGLQALAVLEQVDTDQQAAAI